METVRILKYEAGQKLELVSILDRKTQIETPVLMHVPTGLIIGVHLPKAQPSPYTPEGGEAALIEIVDAGGFVPKSYIFGFICNHIGGHLYEPPIYQLHKTAYLECSVCGKDEIGRQWHNRDNGFGLCSDCVSFASRGYSHDSFQQTYGLEGYHFSIPKAVKKPQAAVDTVC